MDLHNGKLPGKNFLTVISSVSGSPKKHFKPLVMQYMFSAISYVLLKKSIEKEVFWAVL